MRIQTVQFDGKMPNLALLKIRAYHRARGDTINGGGTPDRVYISCVFAENRGDALGAALTFPDSEVLVGGVGMNYEYLPKEIEDTPINWSVEGMDYAMGHTSRGCPRNCPFCIVPKFEGLKVKEWHTIDHISQGATKMILLDSNILMSPKWKEKLETIRDNGHKVSFNGGLDLRAVDYEKAGLLADIKSYDLDFNKRRYYCAFDLMKNESWIRKGLTNLIDAGVNPHNILCYMLIGFDTTFEQDMYRYEMLAKEFKVMPYPQLYNSTKNRKLRAFARWIIRRYDQVCSWEDYRRHPR